MAYQHPIDMRLKPLQPYKRVITPSSLYKANCPRCTWMSYWHGFAIPANLALQQQMSRLQEGSFDGVPNSFISSDLPEGFASLYKGKFASKAIVVNGEETRWKLYGELDLLSENKDGTYSVIDGKVSMKKDAEDLADGYWKQLEAYVFMLENPEVGEAKQISTIGLLQWRIDGAVDLTEPRRGFTVEERYIPVARNPEGFRQFIESFILIIEGEFPDSGNDCYDCKFLKQIEFYKD